MKINFAVQKKNVLTIQFLAVIGIFGVITMNWFGGLGWATELHQTNIQLTISAQLFLSGNYFLTIIAMATGLILFVKTFEQTSFGNKIITYFKKHYEKTRRKKEHE